MVSVDYSIYLVVRILSFCMNRLPQFLFLGVGRAIGLLLYCLCSSRRKVVHDNLKSCNVGKDLSEEAIEALSKRIFMNVGMTFTEFLCARRYRKNLKKYLFVDPKDRQKVQDILKNRGLILLLSHFYNWELLPVIKGEIETSMLIVGQTIKNPYIEVWLKQRRKDLGLNMVSKQGFIKKAIRTLKKKEIVVLLIDQNAGSHGIPLSFLGRKASTITTPVSLALKTDCPILPIYDIRNFSTGTHRVFVDQVIDPVNYENIPHEERSRQMMRACLDSLEEQIYQDPGGWFWLHRRWKR
jgi:KDO2-lipid IV(A) lauroyltransferase